MALNLVQRLQDPRPRCHEFETRIAAEWYHFNPSGHQGLADLLAERYSPAGGGVQTSNDVDIVFVVDTTGSMGSIMARSHNDLIAIVDNSQLDTKFRVGVVSYRDFQERTGSNRLPAQSRHRSHLITQPSVRNLVTHGNGGGDFPESALGMNADSISRGGRGQR